MEIWWLQALYLKLMCKVLGIPSPKVIYGSQVGHVFYVDKDIDRIVSYCEKVLPWHKYFFDCDEKTYLLRTKLFMFKSSISIGIIV
jgi:hypothetical protein